MAFPWRKAGRAVNPVETYSTQLCAGSGLVVRNDHVVAFIDGHPVVPEGLLERLDEIGAEPAPSASLLRYLQSLPSPVTVAVAFLHHEVDVVMMGEVQLSYRTGTDMARLGEGGPAQLVALPDSVTSLKLHARSSEPEVHPGTSLLRGTVVAGGAEITLRESGAPRTSSAPVLPDPEDRRDDGVERINLLTLDEPGEVQLQPLPRQEHATSGRLKDAIVEGLACNQGHINRLSARYCSSCGRRLQDTLSIRKGVRPPLGTLIQDDGSTFSVDRDYVLGRSPLHDTRVADGSAEALSITDPEREISRIHAEIRLEQWDTLIIDRHSANGTYLRRGGSGGWIRLDPSEWHRLSDGDEIAMGQRVMVFQER